MCGLDQVVKGCFDLQDIVCYISCAVYVNVQALSGLDPMDSFFSCSLIAVLPAQSLVCLLCALISSAFTGRGLTDCLKSFLGVVTSAEVTLSTSNSLFTVNSPSAEGAWEPLFPSI